MPTVLFDGQAIECEAGTVLRNAILAAQRTPHNGQSSWFNCKGLGSCGTCAVKITGPVHELTVREKLRLSFPPHQSKSGLRLACQVKIENDLTVEKRSGFWGQRKDAEHNDI